MVSLKDKFKKKLAGSKTISTDDPTPDFWLSSGNKLINKIISGRYDRGFPQGRIAGIAGPSGAGKSFIIGNAIAQAQKEGYFVLVIDSENALDSEYLSAIGVDTDSDNYLHVSVSSFSAAIEAIHEITEDYHEARLKKTLHELPRLLIVVDSLDFLFTDSMLNKFEEDGEMGNDQGLHARKMKQFLQTLTSDIKFLPALAICTKQVYVDQTPNAQPPWKMSEAAKFAFTQLLLVTKLMERDATTKEYNGINLRVFGWKTRGCKPFQRCEVKVPYDDGMDEYEGMLPVAVSMGLVEKSGSWYTYQKHKWQGDAKWRELGKDVKEEVFSEIVKQDIKFIDVAEGVEEEGPSQRSTTKAKKEGVASAVDRIKQRKAEGEEEAGE
jgi:recombination protein RecA